MPENGRGAREQRGDWRADYAALGGAALVAAMRQGDARALEEFIARHRALLVHEARRCGIPDGEREDAAAELLHDTAVRLMTTRDAAAPRSLAAYLATAMRRRAQNAARQRRRRERHEQDAADAAGADPAPPGGGAPAEPVSTAPVPDEEDDAAPAVAPALARLAVALERGLGDEERQLLRWMESHVPQSVIGQWLGISHGAAALRVWRLRARLRGAAVRYAATLAPDERRELLRFFRRAPAARGTDALLRELETLAGGGGGITEGPVGPDGEEEEP